MQPLRSGPRRALTLLAMFGLSAVTLTGCFTAEIAQQKVSLGLARQVHSWPAGFTKDGKAGPACNINLDCADPRASVAFYDDGQPITTLCTAVVDWALKVKFVEYGVDTNSGQFTPEVLAKPLTPATRADAINTCKTSAPTDANFWAGNDQGDPAHRVRVVFGDGPNLDGNPSLYITYGTDGTGNITYASATDWRANVSISDLGAPSKGFLGLFSAKRTSLVCMTNDRSGTRSFTVHLLATGAPKPDVTSEFNGLAPNQSLCNNVKVPGTTSSLTLVSVNETK